MITLAFVGMDSDELKGYDYENVKYGVLKKSIKELVKDLVDKYGFNQFLCGAYKGFDFACFNALKELHKEVTITAAFKKEANLWRTSDKIAYNNILKRSDKVIYVDEQLGYYTKNTGYEDYYIGKYFVRNKYLVDHCDMLLCCWDGNCEGMTWNAIEYAVKKNKPILVIDPVDLSLKIYKDAKWRNASRLFATMNSSPDKIISYKGEKADE